MLEEIRNYCLAKPGVEETLPFDEDSPVYKVMGKMFAIISVTPPHCISLKCDPERAVELREVYEGITPGYHMNKVHWNTVQFDGSVPVRLVNDLVDHSYELVVAALPKKMKEELQRLKDEE